MAYVKAKRCTAFPGRPSEILADGAVRSLPGNAGCILFGPYIRVPAGIHHVTLHLRSLVPPAGSWDVYSSEVIHGAQSFKDGLELYIYAPETKVLEVRVIAAEEEVVVEGFTIECVLREARISIPKIEKLLDRHSRLALYAPSAIQFLSSHLRKLGGADRARSLQLEYAALRHDQVYLAFVEINLTGVPTVAASVVDGMTYDELFHHLKGETPRFVDLTSPSLEARLDTAAWGYDLRHLERCAMSRRSARPWQTADHADGRAPSLLFQALHSLDLEFQLELARGEGLSGVCPVSGRRVTSHHAFCVYWAGMPFLFYRFEGDEVFYTCTGGAYNAKKFIYLPRSDMVVLCEPPIVRWYAVEEVLPRFKAHLLAARHEVKAYLAESTRPALVISNNNLGHFFWNDFGGLHHMVEAGLAPAIAMRLELGRQFADVATTFPELIEVPAFNSDDAVAVFRFCLSQRLLPIRFTEGVLNESFSQRLRRAAERGSTPVNSVPSDRSALFLWINVRAHTKMWLDQIDGYANILSQLLQQYPTVSAVIDGMPDCEDIISAIRAKVSPQVTIYDGTRFSLFDSLNWAFQVDSFICPIGSGLVLVNWLAGRPGVAHAEQAHMEQMSWWPDVRPDAPRPVTPLESEIEDAGDGFYCNYRVDWKLLLELLRSVLRTQGPAPALPALTGEAGETDGVPTGASAAAISPT